MITPSPFAVSVADAQSDDWVRHLDTNAHGLKLLTLSRAHELAAAGCCAGWYISPFALAWTVGRMTSNGRRFHVISHGEPIRFESVGEAFQFLGGILKIGATPQLVVESAQLAAPAGAAKARLAAVPRRF